MRGEHHRFHILIAEQSGSSPHARGAQISNTAMPYCRGLIPACAGSTRGRRCGGRRGEAHPRVRGEHDAPDWAQVGSAGSSPRARGAPARGEPARPDRGLIPACAGSTGGCCSTRSTTGAHPRVRGEHGPIRGSRRGTRGSSPRARGAYSQLFTGALLLGLIPACAGSVWIMTEEPKVIRAHPRVRGERHCGRDPRPHREGSSPRARGALSGMPSTSIRRWLIPACAGSVLPDLRVLSPQPRFSFTFHRCTSLRDKTGRAAVIVRRRSCEIPFQLPAIFPRVA
ncbi:hypothetical protein NFA_50350 [Nocardia farcinica IFM 10152]|nr:hypothetical protein NFA_50350 [Nocardia farcinica IFM 10152]